MPINIIKFEDFTLTKRIKSAVALCFEGSFKKAYYRLVTTVPLIYGRKIGATSILNDHTNKNYHFRGTKLL